jgi:large subunit ribosomal protein L4
MPKKMRRLALKCVLSAKVREGNMKVVEKFTFDRPGTKEMTNILSAFEIDSSVLIVTTDSTPNVIKSASNLASVDVLPSALINIADLLSHQKLLVTIPAIHKIEQIWGRKVIKHASL